MENNTYLDEEEWVCSVCQEGSCNGKDVHTLSCGHHFHTECAIQWFRYNNTSCPNCRSDDLHNVWSRVTEEERIVQMRRNIHILPRYVKKKLEEYDAWNVKQKDRSRILRQFKAQHNTLLKEYHKMSREESFAKRRRLMLFRVLSSLDVSGVRRLRQPL